MIIFTEYYSEKNDT